jgi:hypothetical protein
MNSRRAAVPIPPFFPASFIVTTNYNFPLLFLHGMHPLSFYPTSHLSNLFHALKLSAELVLAPYSQRQIHQPLFSSVVDTSIEAPLLRMHV